MDVSKFNALILRLIMEWNIGIIYFHKLETDSWYAYVKLAWLQICIYDVSFVVTKRKFVLGTPFNNEAIFIQFRVDYHFKPKYLKCVFQYTK